MTTFKKIIGFIIQPFRLVSHKNISEKIALFFSKNALWVYVLSFVFTLIVIYVAYR
jgi:hypothetical protein